MEGDKLLPLRSKWTLVNRYGDHESDVSVENSDSDVSDETQSLSYQDHADTGKAAQSPLIPVSDVEEAAHSPLTRVTEAEKTTQSALIPLTVAEEGTHSLTHLSYAEMATELPLPPDMEFSSVVAGSEETKELDKEPPSSSSTGELERHDTGLSNSSSDSSIEVLDDATNYPRNLSLDSDDCLVLKDTILYYGSLQPENEISTTTMRASWSDDSLSGSVELVEGLEGSGDLERVSHEKTEELQSDFVDDGHDISGSKEKPNETVSQHKNDEEATGYDQLGTSANLKLTMAVGLAMMIFVLGVATGLYCNTGCSGYGHFSGRCIRRKSKESLVTKPIFPDNQKETFRKSSHEPVLSRIRHIFELLNSTANDSEMSYTLLIHSKGGNFSNQLNALNMEGVLNKTSDEYLPDGQYIYSVLNGGDCLKHREFVSVMSKEQHCGAVSENFRICQVNYNKSEENTLPHNVTSDQLTSQNSTTPENHFNERLSFIAEILAGQQNRSSSKTPLINNINSYINHTVETMLVLRNTVKETVEKIRNVSKETFTNTVSDNKLERRLGDVVENVNKKFKKQWSRWVTNVDFLRKDLEDKFQKLKSKYSSHAYPAEDTGSCMEMISSGDFETDDRGTESTCSRQADKCEKNANVLDVFALKRVYETLYLEQTDDHNSMQSRSYNTAFNEVLEKLFLQNKLCRASPSVQSGHELLNLHGNFVLLIDRNDVQNLMSSVKAVAKSRRQKYASKQLKKWMNCQVSWWEAQLRRKTSANKISTKCGQQLQTWQLHCNCGKLRSLKKSAKDAQSFSVSSYLSFLFPNDPKKTQSFQLGYCDLMTSRNDPSSFFIWPTFTESTNVNDEMAVTENNTFTDDSVHGGNSEWFFRRAYSRHRPLSDGAWYFRRMESREGGRHDSSWYLRALEKTRKFMCKWM